MPSGITKRVKKRKQTVLELLADGCKSTSYITQALGDTYEKAYYVLNTLAREGYISRHMFGKSAIWCLDASEYRDLVNTILREIQRIVESRNLRFVYPMRLYRLVLKDRKTLKLIAQFVPVDRKNSSVLSFLNQALHMLYGEPYTKGEKTVYYVAKSGASTLPPHTLEKSQDAALDVCKE
jgi:hypothetical protein